jgi:dTDP-4-dehydrorhamnose reductase
VAAVNPRHVILRTAWVYSPFGRNFVKTMLGLARDLDTIRVVADQTGNPTAASDVAEGILRAAAVIAVGEQASDFGIFHLAGEGSASWAGFAREIFSQSARLGGPSAAVEDIATEDYILLARADRKIRGYQVKSSTMPSPGGRRPGRALAAPLRRGWSEDALP